MSRKEGRLLEEMKKEVEKMKDQIKTLNTSLLILSIIFAVTASCYAFGYHQLHSAVQEAVQCLQNTNSVLIKFLLLIQVL